MFDLQQCQAGDGQDTTNEVNPLQDRRTREAFGSGMVMWEVREEQTEANDAIVYQRTPGSPSPADLCVVVRPKLDVQEVWAEWENEGSDQSKRVATILDRYNLSESK